MNKMHPRPGIGKYLVNNADKHFYSDICLIFSGAGLAGYLT